MSLMSARLLPHNCRVWGTCCWMSTKPRTLAPDCSHELDERQTAPSQLQGLGDVLLDEHQTAQVARPGTSLARPGTGAQSPWAADVKECGMYVSPATSTSPRKGMTTQPPHCSMELACSTVAVPSHRSLGARKEPMENGMQHCCHSVPQISWCK
eukprot:1153875-Pelagomonas_calceolata.AAC.2